MENFARGTTGSIDLLIVSGDATRRPDIDGRQVSVVENGTDPDTVAETAPKALAVGDKLFGRLQAEQP